MSFFDRHRRKTAAAAARLAPHAPRGARTLYPLVRALAGRLARLRAARAVDDPSLPRRVIAELTLRCNLSCAFCFQRDGAPPRADRAELSAASWQALLGRLGARRVKLIGGEVLLRRDLGELLAGLPRARVTLTTNGTLLRGARLEQLLGAPGLERVSISLDPNRPLARLAPASRRLARRVPLLAQVLVTPDRLEALLHLLPRLPGAGFYHLLLMLQMVCSDAEVRRTRALLRRELGWPEEDRGAIMVHRGPAPAGAPPDLGRLERTAWRAGVAPLREVRFSTDAARRFHRGTLGPGERAICHYLLQPTLRLDPAGRLIFCEHLRRPLGPADPRGAWASAEHRALRALLLRRGPLPICRRCCKLVHLPGRAR